MWGQYTAVSCAPLHYNFYSSLFIIVRNSTHTMFWVLKVISVPHTAECSTNWKITWYLNILLLTVIRKS